MTTPRSDISSVRSFAESLQDDAVDLFRMVLRLPALDPRAWTEEERSRAAEVAELLLRIEDGANRARHELERPAKRRSGRGVFPAD